VRIYGKTAGNSHGSRWHRRFRLCRTGRNVRATEPRQSVIYRPKKGAQAQTFADSELGRRRGVARDDHLWKNCGEITQPEAPKLPGCRCTHLECSGCHRRSTSRWHRRFRLCGTDRNVCATEHDKQRPPVGIGSLELSTQHSGLSTLLGSLGLGLPAIHLVSTSHVQRVIVSAAERD